MIVIAYYLLKVIICSGILFLYYQAFLRNKLFHQWNRFYLLGAVILSLCLPLIKFNVETPQQSSADILNYLLLFQSADHYMEAFTVYYQQGFSTEDWLKLSYAVVSFALLCSVIISVNKIRGIIRSHQVTEFEKFKLLSTKEPGTPFSFLHYIFWNDDIPLQSSAGQQIFQHELVHVHEKHTWDKLFMQFILVFFWCNPFFWLIRKELRFVHEFVADQKAVGDDTDAFAAMILQTVYPSHFDSVRNPFFQTSIKRRLHMLNQTKSPRVAYISRLVALPLIATVTFAFTVRTKELPRELAPIPVFNSLIISTTDTLPKKQKQISSVDVNRSKQQLTITYADGSVDTMTEKEAIAKGLIQNSDFSNRRDGAKGQTPGSSIRIRNNENPPLFILNGDEVNKSEIDKLDPGTIESVNVLKDAAAVAAYGEKGKNGVVEIKTKKSLSNEQSAIQGNGKSDMNVSNDPNHQKTSLEEVTVIGKKMNPDPVFEKAEFEPSVNQDEWRKFLEKHTLPIIGQVGKTAPTGKYTVNVRFVVEKDGSISGVQILNDPGYGIGPKVLEMMKNAPKWKPAIQNQRVVRSYHTQPITFVIADT